MKKVLPCSVCIVLTILVTACCDEGAADFRKAAKPSMPSCCKDSNIFNCLVGVQQQAGFASKQFVFRKHDSISIRLRSGFIKEAGAYYPENFSGLIKGFKRNAEIAIVVRVFELTPKNDFDFTNNGVKRGRLVYYGSDVENKQYLNFNNLPIYGPTEYQGGSIGLELYVLEMDCDNEYLDSLLSTLARAGINTYTPTDPTLSILENMGESLLNTAQMADIVVCYRFLLDPYDNSSSLIYPTVEEGDYIVLKKEWRQSSMNWENLSYDYNTGRLYKKAYKQCRLRCEERSLKSTIDEYRDETYLIVQIKKTNNTEDIELPSDTVAEQLNIILKEAKKDTATQESLKRIVDDASREILNSFEFMRAKTKLFKIEGKEDRYRIKDTIAYINKQANNPNDRLLEDNELEYLILQLKDIVDPNEADSKLFKLECFKQLDPNAIVETIISSK